MLDIAFGVKSIEPRDVVGANFKYNKVVSLPFFGGGIVDMPPGGFKQAKNSRKMHMIFFVASGKVDVTVAENAFSISKGGIWQVPRGKFPRSRSSGEGHMSVSTFPSSF